MSREDNVILLPERRVHTIYVLEDGETYSGSPAIAVEITDDELDRIEGGEKVYNVVPDWNNQGG